MKFDEIKKGMCVKCFNPYEKNYFLETGKVNEVDRKYRKFFVIYKDGNIFSYDAEQAGLFDHVKMVVPLKVKYFSEDVEKLRYIDGKSDWIDLRASEDIELKKGEFKLIPLGIAVELPTGYEAHMIPRSSTYKNFHILQTNSMGLIDESYCGDNDQWYFPALAMEDTVIHKNDRICQFRIMKHQPELQIIEVEHLTGADRGGIGSTGKQ